MVKAKETDEVQDAIAVLEKHGVKVNVRPPGVSERDDIVAWLRANGHDREANTVENARLD